MGLVFLLNIVFAGRMTNNSAAKLAGVGLGNMFLGMFCRQILNGMNSALETMASHAYGKGDVRMAGVHLNRSRVIMTIVEHSVFMNWMPHLCISCPATFIIVLEVWAVEVLGFFAGWISINDQAVNSILQCFNSVMFMVPIDAQAAACALIGE